MLPTGSHECLHIIVHARRSTKPFWTIALLFEPCPTHQQHPTTSHLSQLSTAKKRTRTKTHPGKTLRLSVPATSSIPIKHRLTWLVSSTITRRPPRLPMTFSQERDEDPDTTGTSPGAGMIGGAVGGAVAAMAAATFVGVCLYKRSHRSMARRGGGREVYVLRSTSGEGDTV